MNNEKWEHKKLRDCLTIGNGFDYKHLKMGEIPVFGTGGIMTYVDDYLYDGETVCIGRKGTINKPIYHDGKIWTVDTLFYTHSFVDVDPLFIYYSFCNINWDRYNEATGVPSLSKETIYKIEIPVPTLPAQRRIAAILSAADKVIASTQKVIAKYKQMKQGMMDDLLKPKEGWKMVRLGEVALIVRGGSPRPIDSYITTEENGINWIKIGDIDVNGKYVEKTSEKILSEGKLYSREVHNGDFILSNSMSFGRPYIVKIDGCIHDGWLAIQNYEHVFDTDFLFYVLSSDMVKSQYSSMASGSTVLNLNKEKVAQVTIAVPSIVEQRRISKILSGIDKKIEAEQAILNKYTLIKMGLMEKLLNEKNKQRSLWQRIKNKQPFCKEQ